MNDKRAAPRIWRRTTPETSTLMKALSILFQRKGGEWFWLFWHLPQISDEIALLFFSDRSTGIYLDVCVRSSLDEDSAATSVFTAGMSRPFFSVLGFLHFHFRNLCHYMAGCVAQVLGAK